MSGSALEQVAGWGYEAVLASAHGGGGLEELRARLRGHTSVVAGPSGVGKSSLINALLLPPSPSLGLGTTGEGSVEGTGGRPAVPSLLCKCA